jgi:hypothetical protein
MHPLNLTRPTELTGALMENELLRYEVRFLKGRLSAATGEFPPGPDEIAAARREAAKKSKQDSPGPGPGPGPAPGPGPGAAIARRNEQAYDDIVWLVGRLDSSPVGVLLRRWAGFRTLRERYSGGSAQ